MRSVEAIIKQFRKHGLRVTPQRRIIIELLEDNGTHPTVDDLFQHVKSKLPEVSLATVYNTLHELVALGELKQVEGLAGGSTRYDTNTSHHHHLFCEKCHQLVDIDAHLDDVQFPEEALSGYLIKRRQVTFYGICPGCQRDAV
jgi:Fe2+ or Zn2+ uptake regulation protein